MSSAHLTDDQISRYGSRTLAPADLLALDGHIAECEDCRGRLAQAGNAWREAARLRADLDGHL
ncbi:MAG TPA: zf-HC2 domain-containing protein, partial [Bryobacteraceae bacterium]|nr:zf-HC2 domain-containing protein [Bryobacteraceae bacterium]